MQQLAKASELSKKGDVYQSQGNYDYAADCYKKVVLNLELLITRGIENKDSEKQLKDKITKYNNKLKEMLLKQNDKKKKQPIIAKLGFPKDANTSSINNLLNDRISLNINKFPLKNQVPVTLKANKTQDNIHIKKGVGIFNKVQPNHLYKQNAQNQIAKKKILQEIPQQIRGMIVDTNITFDDIVGMTQIKKTLEQTIIRPRKRPDLYSGIRSPPKGILLYGPPGNGKTYICKALANESGCTFFALSASSIMNKLVGETEKMLKNIFQAAYKLSPSIIFIDEIDSILTARSENENESSRRLKTEFLVLLDGISSPKGGQILVIGATNLPNELDLAAKRRFNKLIYIGMPEKETREQIIVKNLEEVNNKINETEMKNIVKKLEGYSASEITNIIKEVCMIPLRQISTKDLETVNKSKIRCITAKDFYKIIGEVKPLLTKEDLLKYGERI